MTKPEIEVDPKALAGRTVAEISKADVNIQQRLVEKGFARIYKRYANQCPWSR